jgi:hypothetical protein
VTLSRAGRRQLEEEYRNTRYRGTREETAAVRRMDAIARDIAVRARIISNHFKSNSKKTKSGARTHVLIAWELAPVVNCGHVCACTHSTFASHLVVARPQRLKRADRGVASGAAILPADRPAVAAFTAAGACVRLRAARGAAGVPRASCHVHACARSLGGGGGGGGGVRL